MLGTEFSIVLFMIQFSWWVGTGCVFWSLHCRSRKENLTRAIEHEADGNSTAAFECYQKAVDISPAIAYELIQVRVAIFSIKENLPAILPRSADLSSLILF